MIDKLKMPKYKCHKEVWAIKIDDIDLNFDGKGAARITPEDPRHPPFLLDIAFMQKHQPLIGGYIVVYEDDYISFSPEKPFEEGYEQIDEQNITKTLTVQPKPIFFVGLPNTTNLADLSRICNDLEKSMTDYHVMVFKQHHSCEIEFNVFYEKDFNHVRYEELKAIVEEQVKSK